MEFHPFDGFLADLNNTAPQWPDKVADLFDGASIRAGDVGLRP